MKEWYEHLYDFLVGSLIRDSLQEAAPGSSPEASLTLNAHLPAFSQIPAPPAGVEESRDLQHCHPELIVRYAQLERDFREQTGRDVFITCTWRSKEKQHKLYEVGRRGVPGEKILTKIDGITSRSRHNVYPSEAIDVCVDSDPGPGKHPVWDEASYAILGPLCAKYGLIWGGSWVNFPDFPHIQLPAEAA